jgi:hypothetical protein
VREACHGPGGRDADVAMSTTVTGRGPEPERGWPRLGLRRDVRRLPLFRLGRGERYRPAATLRGDPTRWRYCIRRLLADDRATTPAWLTWRVRTVRRRRRRASSWASGSGVGSLDGHRSCDPSTFTLDRASGLGRWSGRIVLAASVADVVENLGHDVTAFLGDHDQGRRRRHLVAHRRPVLHAMARTLGLADDAFDAPGGRSRRSATSRPHRCCASRRHPDAPAPPAGSYGVTRHGPGFVPVALLRGDQRRAVRRPSAAGPGARWSWSSALATSGRWAAGLWSRGCATTRRWSPCRPACQHSRCSTGLPVPRLV